MHLGGIVTYATTAFLGGRLVAFQALGWVIMGAQAA